MSGYIAVISLILSRVFFGLIGGSPSHLQSPFSWIVFSLLVLGVAWVVSCYFLYYKASKASKIKDDAAYTDPLRESASTTVLFIITMFLLDVELFTRLFYLLFFAVNFLLLLAYRTWRQYRNTKADTIKHKNAIIIGSKQRAQDIIKHIHNDMMLDYRIIGALETDPSSVGQQILPGFKVIGVLQDLENLLRREVVDEIIFAIPLREIPNVQYYFDLAEKVGAVVRIAPDWQVYSLDYKPHIASLEISTLKGIQTLTLVTTRTSFIPLLIKEVFDVIFAFLLLTLSIPLFVVVAASLKLYDGGPVFYKQTRIGTHGRPFQIYKFRTMIKNASALQATLQEKNEADGPVFKIKNDPRIIPVIGKILRKSGLDELPQIINILRGEMSLIGPRPPIETEVFRYEIPQLRRLSIKPGITGLWQCTPNRNQLPFQTWIELDLQYIDNWSLWLDAKIFAKTILIFFRFDGL